MAGDKCFLIYVVDDENIIAVTVAAILRKTGFQSLAFTNPIQALDSARLNPPDVLLTDVLMPELSGIELAIQLRAFCPECRILLFSGQAGTSDMLDAARAQGHDFAILAKPIHPTDLLASISALRATGKES
jgi:CheY-like chemotaxis protein